MNILKIDTVVAILSFVLIVGCSASRKIEKTLQESLEEESFFIGINVVNLETGKQIIDYEGDRLFTPASNVKLFTLYAALQVLPDSVPSFEYIKENDSLIIRGAANPMFLKDSLCLNSLDFLNNSEASVYLLDEEISDEVYGPGWSWEDYSMPYMPERNLFPIYGNTVTFYKVDDEVEVFPLFFEEKYNLVPSGRSGRDKDLNEFYLNAEKASFDRRVPFRTSNQLVADLLSEELNSKVTLLPNRSFEDYSVFNEILYDSLYVRMIQDSDNFIAEQILLQVSKELTGVYNSQKGISQLLDSSFINIPQKPRWVDGSGLSRYNLFSPQSMVYVLELLYKEHDHEKVMSYFPSGGETGTLKNGFEGLSFIRAKSGTLSNNYCLSGYLTTKKGSVLAFSYMNNHYLGSSSERKKEMISLFQQLYENY